MVFEIKNKVALVTGGASGIGFEYCKELLRNGAKAVTMADVNEAFGEKAILEITGIFGKNKALFVKTDVTDEKQFENAFKRTIETFKNIDILINNAGYDGVWEKVVDINLKGTIIGCNLGQAYLKKHKTSEDQEGLIVNIGSISGLNPYTPLPVFTATKFAIQGLTRALGHPSNNDGKILRIVGVFPGPTATESVKAYAVKMNWGDYPMQSPQQCAEQAMTPIKTAESGSIWVVQQGKTYEHKFDNPQKN